MNHSVYTYYRQDIIIFTTYPRIHSAKTEKKNETETKLPLDFTTRFAINEFKLNHPGPPIVHQNSFTPVDVVTDPCGFLRRSRTWRCTRKTAVGRGPNATCWARTATMTRKSSCAAGSRWRWTSRTLAGTGSLHPKSTRPTTVRESVRWCSCKSTRTPISPSSPTSRARIRAPVRAAPPARCPPYRCCTSTRTWT